MTKQEIIDYIRLTFRNIDKTNAYHPEFIEKACDLVYAQMLKSMFTHGYHGEDIGGSLELFTKEYTSQTATLDATKNLYYTTLPCAIVEIPNVSSGVLTINTNAGSDLDFTPTTEQEYKYMGGSVVQLIDTAISYWIQGTKIWYNESMTSAIAAAGVRLVVVPRFSVYSRTDTVNIPGASDMDFVQSVINLLTNKQPVDLRANNADR